MKTFIKSVLRTLGLRKDPPADKPPEFFPDVPAVRPDNELQRCIDRVRTATNQMSNIEYGVLMGILIRSAPLNLLVFGLGRDFELWVHLNKGGRTVFLEDNAEWMREVPGAETYLVKYPNLVLPESVNAKIWDLIIVDAPMGWKPEHPGRGESILTAYQLRADHSVVFVHDYNRAGEHEHCKNILGPPTHYYDRCAFFTTPSQ
jgi:glucuronoxylan 4-O-methyltransferase